jgi:hypothetical protein
MKSIHNNSEVQMQFANKPVLPALLSCKCPRCRSGNMFVHENPWKLNTTMKMYNECPACGQSFNIEVGFYYGSSYISYALSTAFSVATFIAWWVLIGFSFQDNRFFYWLTFNCISLIALQPYVMRLARTGWLSFFVRYDRNWWINEPITPERTNKEQENNW